MNRQRFGRKLTPVISILCLVLLLATPISTPPLAARFVDAIVAQVDMNTISASDVGLAKALGLYGLEKTGPIRPGDIDRFIDARLIVAESLRLEVNPPDELLEKSWNDVVMQRGGMQRFGRWLAEKGVSEDWARQMVRNDARREYFIQLRFVRFVFIPEEDVTKALGRGAHDAKDRDRTREVLREKQASRDLALWLKEQRGRTTIRRFTDGEVPNPLVIGDSERTP